MWSIKELHVHLNNLNKSVNISPVTTWHHVSAKVGTNFANKSRSLCGIVRSRTQATDIVLNMSPVRSVSI
jgi:hypothetical protein